MRRWSGWIAICWLILIGAVALLAYGSSPSSGSLTDRTRVVAQELRCLVCQGESVADSPSAFSKSIRATIRERLARGESPEAIKSYLVSRYGDTILLAPPASGIGSVAWVAPPLLLLGGMALLVTLVTDWRTKSRGPSGRTSQAYLERVRAELAADSAPD